MDWKSVGLILVSLVFLSLGGGSAIAGFKTWRTLRRLKHHGVSTGAEIIDRHIAHSSRSYTYYLTYRYLHNGERYTHKQPVSHKTYSALPIGAPVHIRYLPYRPAVSALEHGGTARSDIIGYCVATVICLPMGGFMLFGMLYLLIIKA